MSFPTVHSKLQFMALGEILLAPDAASVGMEIRVIGNDSGEKVLGGNGRMADAAR